MLKILINKKSPNKRGFLLFSEAGCFLLTSIELVHRTRFEKGFLSSVEWMTFRTCFHTDFTSFDRTERIESMSTRTDNFYLFHLWVNIFFHKWKWVKSNCDRSSQNDRVRRPLLLFIKNGEGGNQMSESLKMNDDNYPSFRMIHSRNMVPRKRLELLHLTATASKTVVSTNSTTWASKSISIYFCRVPLSYLVSLREYSHSGVWLLSFRESRTSTNSTTWARKN